MPLLHEQSARSLYEQHAKRHAAPEQAALRMRVALAAGACGLVFLGMYVFLVATTYDFAPAQASLAQVVQQVQAAGEVAGETVAEVQTSVEKAVVENMKKQIETN